MTIYCQLGGSQDVLCDFNLFIYNKLSNVKKAYMLRSICKGGCLAHTIRTFKHL